MPHSLYTAFVRIMVILIWASLPAAQWIAFRELERRGSDGVAVFGRSVRDHILAALLRAATAVFALAAVAFLLWATAFRRGLAWDALVAGEILLAAVLFLVGLTAVAVRLSLGLLERTEAETPAAARSVFLIRLSVLAAGAAYALALWILHPGTPTELLISLLALGAGLTGLGLNRTGRMPAGVLVRLADVLRRR